MGFVRDIMSPGSVTLPSSSPTLEAVKLMRDKNIGSVLVVDEGKLVGIITERDIVRLIAEDDLEKPLSETMTKDPIVVHPDDPIVVALAKMVEHNIRHLPVVDDNGTPVGVVSIRDIAKHVL